MTKPLPRDSIYSKRQFDSEIIVLPVVHHLHVVLSGSGRDDGRTRRCDIAITTIMRW